MITVEPRVFLDGVFYDCVSSVKPLDGIRVSWGRSSSNASASPASATVQVLDTSGAWLTKVQNNTAIGRPLRLEAQLMLDDSPEGDPWVFYRGNITDISIQDGPLNNRTGVPTGQIVTVTAADPTAVLGNIVPSMTTIPLNNEYTMVQRAFFLQYFSDDFTGIDDMFFDPYYVDSKCSTLDVKNQNIGSLVDAFYRSLGTTYSYSPKDNVIRNTPAFTGGSINTSFYRWSDGYLHINSDENPRDGAFGEDTDRYYGTSISGCYLKADSTVISQTTSGKINGVQVNWKNHLDEDQTKAQSWAGPNEPQHLLTSSTWLRIEADVSRVTADIQNQVDRAGRVPLHTEVMFDTRLSGGFESVIQAQNLIMAGERQYPLFISGTPWTVKLDRYIPLFFVIGGEFGYERGRWVFKLTLQPYYHFRSELGWPGVSWSQMPTSVGWGDSGSGEYLEPGIQWFDTKFVTNPVIKEYSEEMLP